MSQILSVCGLLCNDCDYFNKECKGCYKVKGATFWAKKVILDKLCPLYKCSVLNKNYNNCGKCPELPCAIFNKLKDPNISDEEHNKLLIERVNRLKELQ